MTKSKRVINVHLKGTPQIQILLMATLRLGKRINNKSGKKVEALRFETSTKFLQQEYKMVSLEETTIAIQALTLHFKIDLFRKSTNAT